MALARIGRWAPSAQPAARRLALCRACSSAAPRSAQWLLAEAARPPAYSSDGQLRPGLSAMLPPWEGWLLDDAEDEAVIAGKCAALDTPALRPRLSVSDHRAETIDAEHEVFELIAESAVGSARIARSAARTRAGRGVAARARGTGTTAPRLESAARIVREDLVLLRQSGDAPSRVAAATVCFSFGQLCDKVGQTLGAVHAPVPGYARSLGRSMDALFARLTPQKGFSRSNFELRWDEHLLHPSARGDPSRKGQLGEPEACAHKLGPDDMHVRVEYQTLRRLERSAHILFTVRTYSDPLSTWARSAAAAAALHSRISSLGEEMAAYKGIHGEMRPRIEAYLLEASRQRPVQQGRADAQIRD